MSSAVSVCSIGSGGAVTSEADFAAWLDTVSPPDSVTVLGHELRRDGMMLHGESSTYVAMLGNQHALVATRYVRGDWRVALLRFDADHTCAAGTGATLDEAVARMLVATHRSPELGVEVVLQLRLIGGAR